MDIFLSEEELISSIKQNSRSGFNYLYTNYSSALSFVVKKVIRDEHTAEDILQEVFVNIWNNIGQFDRKKGTFYNWMLNIARNRSVDFLRSRVGQMKQRTDHDETKTDTITNNTEEHSDRIGISRIVMEMPANYKELIYLAYYKGHTIREIAKIHDIPMGTVKTRMRATLSHIRSEFNYSLPEVA